MNQSGRSTSIFAILIGAFLVIEGLWGLTSQAVFGILTTNLTHAIIHIVLGIVGICVGCLGKARGYCIFLGVLLLAVGILRFIPGADELIVRILNANIAVAWMNIVIGLVALIISFLPAGLEALEIETARLRKQRD